MSGKRQWKDLDSRTRKVLVVSGVVEGILKVAALADLKRRPAERVRGRRWVWATAVVLANSFGLVPIAYFVFGRRERSE